MKTYAIMGATGQVGGAVARSLIAHGANVRAIVRNDAAAQAWQGQGATTALATLEDPVALEQAFEGAHGVFVMTPTWFSALDMFSENRAAIASLSTALRSARVGKVVLLSSVGAQHEHGTGAIGKMHLMEQALTDLPALTSIRAACFMENYAGLMASVRASGTLASMLVPPGRAIPMVATADIGAVAARRLLDEWTGQHVIELAGPRDYSPDDVAAVFATVLQREVAVQTLAPSAWPAVFEAWGLTPVSSAAMAAMTAGFNNEHIRFSQAAHQIVRGATPLAAVLAAG
jgi:NAD(P)H dehydrogenase (quinone)